MRQAIWGFLVVSGLTIVVIACRSDRNHVHAQHARHQLDARPGLTALTVPAGNNVEYVALVDPLERVMSVYEIDPQSGEIQLKSVRNVYWDLKMDEWNGTSPSPGAIRAMVNVK